MIGNKAQAFEMESTSGLSGGGQERKETIEEY